MINNYRITFLTFNQTNVYISNEYIIEGDDCIRNSKKKNVIS